MDKKVEVQLLKQEENHVYIFFEETKKDKICKYMHSLPNTIQENLKEYKRNCNYRRVIYVDNQYVGDIWCHSLFQTNKYDALISCCVFNEKYWNKGIASKSMNLFLEEIKGKLFVQKVGAYLYENNLGSIRVLEKNNFKRVDEFFEKDQKAFFYLKEL